MRAMIVILGIVALAASEVAAAERVALPMAVALVSIQPGETVTAELVSERELLTTPQLARSYHRSAAEVVGKVAQRPLPAGRAIPVNALREPYAFKEGDRIPVVFAVGGLDIRGVGIAMKPGVTGKSTEVRNLDTGVVVRGTVQADGSVRLGEE